MLPTENKIINKGLKDSEFKFFADLIYNHCGIHLNDDKKQMLEMRLRKRMKILSINSFANYMLFVDNAKNFETEITPLIDVVTTNKTDFFREAEHFDFLKDTIIPDFLKERGHNYSKKINIWSSASSTGQEPYTIAIVLSELLSKNTLFDFSIIATDIATNILDKALKGVYEIDNIVNLPLELKQKYFLKGTNKSAGLVKIKKSIRQMVKYKRLNLIDDIYAGIPLNNDVIFCRNVLIYFDKQTQEKVIGNLLKHLNVGGYFIMGHSETMHGFNFNVKRVTSTIYRKFQ